MGIHISIFLASTLIRFNIISTTFTFQVGRIASKCATFANYVLKAFEKLNIQLCMTEQEINEIYETFASKHRSTLFSFFQLRALFGPLIEGLILLDRTVYLMEQPGISEVYLVRLFDAVVSPRCYGIIALKE